MNNFVLIAYYRTGAGYSCVKLKEGQEYVTGSHGFDNLAALARSIKIDMEDIPKGIPVAPINMVPDNRHGSCLSLAKEKELTELLIKV